MKRCFAGLAGYSFLSAGLGRVANIGPPEFCSWAALATKAILRGSFAGSFKSLPCLQTKQGERKRPNQSFSSGTYSTSPEKCCLHLPTSRRAMSPQSCQGHLGSQIATSPNFPGIILCDRSSKRTEIACNYVAVSEMASLKH